MTSADKVNILVVDDLPEKLLVFRTILDDLNENVVAVQSGREALRRLLEQDFAVILLDVNMPDMDGFETATLIRQRQKSEHTPIIFITAFADEIHASRGYSLGAVDFILAPVNPEILRTKVRVFVDLFRKTEQVTQQAEERVLLAREQVARAAAEEATRRATFLAEASSALASSLDYHATLRRLLELVLPTLGDWSAITQVDEHGCSGQTNLAWVDDGGLSIESAVDPQRLPAPVAEALQRVVAEGKSEYLPDIAALGGGEAEAADGVTGRRADGVTASMCQQEEPRTRYSASDNAISPRHPVTPSPRQDDTPSPPPSATAPDFNLTSALILPLQVRGRMLAVLTLALGRSDRHYQPADLALARDLAHRAAIALDNARLYHDIQESDRRKNEFLAMLAHELRNPLAPIRSAVQIMRLTGPDLPDLRWAREVIDRQVQHMVRLVDDLLDVSRITRGKIKLQLETVDIATVVASAVETCRPLIDTRKHELAVSLPRESLWVEGDAARLSQVLGNLLNNAAKFTEEGGQVSLTVDRDGADVVVRVKDTGIGIPPEMLSYIFDLFTQVERSLDRSQGGLGIGLTLVRRLVELHQGSVHVTSAGPNQGSEFVVRLPLMSQARAPGPSINGAHKTPAACARCRILLVDDNIDGANSLAKLLEMSGHEVHVVYDGVAGIQAAKTLLPDIVLLDIGLPGMDGYEVARQLREEPALKDVPLVAVSGYAREEDRLRSQQAGFNHHLVKPLDPRALPALFASLLRQPVPRPGRPS
jgi:signal transduction histidine kinase/DNA-binding response OmpR family regulator